MLHELLFALKGHCGGVFKSTSDGIQVLANVPFIHSSEVAVLNDLCRIGTLYKDLIDFIQLHGCVSGLLFNEHTESQDLHGLYLKFFCQGLDTVLQDYRQTLLQLEQDILCDPHLPVSHLACKLQQFHLLFPILASTVDHIVTHKAHGCYILDILYKNSVYGVPPVKEALNRILHVCHRQLFKQLTSWMLYGITADPYKEFFIQEASEDIAKAGQADKDIEDDDDDDLGIMGITGKQLQKVYLGSEDSNTSVDTGQYCVAADLLPSYIPVRVAKKILFVGESVQMCEKGKHKMKSAHHSGTIMNTREKDFAGDLQELSKQAEFNAIGFETVVDKIRAHAAEYLWVLAVEDADLNNQLRIMKDFFLLGRGELYLTFIDQAQHLLRTPVASTTELDVNRAFQQAARDVLFDNDALIQRFHLTAKKTKSDNSANAGEVEVGWNVLGLSYSAPWPLHIFFTPSILEKYNKVFKFLLAVRRTQLDLQNCWSQQMFNKKTNAFVTGSPTWQLRTHMAFLVDNLQYYLQVDVIESQYKILLDKINSTKDFEVAKLAHEQFLSSLLAQSFIHVKAISSCINGILEQCSLFCRLLVSAQSRDESEMTQLETITENFRRHSKLLFRILTGVRAHIHLAQLLLRLDFNKFFTNIGGQLGRFPCTQFQRLQMAGRSIVEGKKELLYVERLLKYCSVKLFSSLPELEKRLK